MTYVRIKERTKEHNNNIRKALLSRGVGISAKKKCPRCGNDLLRKEFKIRTNGLSKSYCISCERKYNNEKSRKWLLLHPEGREHRKIINKKVKLKKFGLTLDVFNKMIKNQGNKCAICNKTPIKRNLSVDHDHSDGRIRSLLCVKCNWVIGLMDDDPRLLIRAAKYLSLHDNK